MIKFHKIYLHSLQKWNWTLFGYETYHNVLDFISKIMICSNF